MREIERKETVKPRARALRVLSRARARAVLFDTQASLQTRLITIA